jgi:hypothetical protein
MLHLHSTIAIVLLLALVISIVITLSNYLGNKPYNRKIALLGFIASHHRTPFNHDHCYCIDYNWLL